MNLFDLAEDVTANRHGGNPCSEAAFRRARPHLTEQRAEVLRLITVAGPEGMTSKEVAAGMETRINCISGRLTELKQDGLIWDTGRRRDGCAVYRAGKPGA